MTQPVIGEARVYCHSHGVCLFEGEVDPDGGAAGVWERAGCPPLGCSQEALDGCPNRDGAAALELGPAPADQHDGSRAGPE